MTNRAWLRSLPVLQAQSPPFDPDDAPATPAALFVTWLTTAVEAGVPEPHVMTLSTITPEGHPDARVLIIKDIETNRQQWAFATPAASPKAVHLEHHPQAAMTFYWPAQGRQIRLRGDVTQASREVCEEDFAQRSPAARAGVPGGAAGWQVFLLAATEAEFLQADVTRRHVRLLYTRTGTTWARRRVE